MELDNKSILVTGGNGFIGAAIANRLTSQDIFVNIFSLNNEFNWRIQNKDNCKLFIFDIRNKSEVENHIKKIEPDIIFHLAGYVNPERDLNVINDTYSINLKGTQNLILSLMEYDYDLFINTGTSDEYGYNVAPFKEIQREKPVSPYSASKVASTFFCEMVSNIYNKPIITVRPFLAYGPTQIARLLIPWLIYSGIEKKKLLLTPCEQTRDFIYIDDLVDAYISLALNVKKINKGGIFNIGSGKEIKILRIVAAIQQKIQNTQFIIGGKEYRRGEAMHFYSSIKKITQTIGWEPKWSIEDGIEETINWWLKNRDIWKNYINIWE